MSEINKVEKQPDGSVVYSHGHRFPDNVQEVAQYHDASGKLISARVKWSGFAGNVLDITAIFDEQGNLVQEEGFRDQDMKTSVKDLLKPLPADALATPIPEPSSSPAAAPSLGERLQEIYAPARPARFDDLDGSEN